MAISAEYDWVEGGRDRDTSLVDRIRRTVDGSLVPRHVGILMHTVRQFRNINEHDDHRCSENELTLVSLSWKEIRDWAESGGWKSSRFS